MNVIIGSWLVFIGWTVRVVKGVKTRKTTPLSGFQAHTNLLFRPPTGFDAETWSGRFLNKSRKIVFVVWCDGRSSCHSL